MSKTVTRTTIAVLCAALLSASAHADPKIVEFQGPNAIETHAGGIDAKGDIGGYTIDNTFATHGFVRGRKGAYSVFQNGDSAPEPLVMNAKGQTTGFAFNADGFYRGFLAQKDGSYTAFEANGAGTYTVGTAIGPQGDVAGYWILGSGPRHGFARTTDGAVALFDCVGGTFDSRQGTYPSVVTKKGEVYGSCVDRTWNSKGFLRSAAGTFKMIGVPEAGTGSFQGTTLVGVNNKGTLGGVYVGNDSQPHPFLRPRGGDTVSCILPNANANQTTATGLNDHDVLVGYFQDFQSVVHGFICTADGTVTVFDSTSAGSVGTATRAMAINDKGEIAGDYSFSGQGGAFYRKP